MSVPTFEHILKTFRKANAFSLIAIMFLWATISTAMISVYVIITIIPTHEWTHCLWFEIMLFFIFGASEDAIGCKLEELFKSQKENVAGEGKKSPQDKNLQ